MSYSSFGQASGTSSVPIGSTRVALVASDCPAGTVFKPVSPDPHVPGGTCETPPPSPSTLATVNKSLTDFWNGGLLNKAAILGGAALVLYGISRLFVGSKATPNRRRRYRANSFAPKFHVGDVVEWLRYPGTQVVGSRSGTIVSAGYYHDRYGGYVYNVRAVDGEIRVLGENQLFLLERRLKKATPNRRRYRGNYSRRIYGAVEHRVKRASSSELRRMATWMSQSAGTVDPTERKLLAGVRAELRR